jgi:hypothetical protein
MDKDPMEYFFAWRLLEQQCGVACLLPPQQQQRTTQREQQRGFSSGVLPIIPVWLILWPDPDAGDFTERRTVD